MVRNVLRGYSYVFEGVLSLMALAVGGVAAISGNASLHIGWLPFDAGTLVSWLIGLGIAGLLLVLLAMTGHLRFLLFLFAAAACYILIKGLFLGSYMFAGPEEGRNALWLVAGALLAAVGSIPGRSRRRP